MRVFVTGASGHLGSAIVPELIAAGHDVTGLARSEAAAATVTAFGTTAHRGDLTDLDGLAKAAADSDGVIHRTLDRHGFARPLIAIARQTGVAGYPGDGTNRWPAGHTLDVGHLYRLALEDAPAGTRWHAAGDEGIPLREIAQSIGDHLGLPTASIPA